MRTILFALAAVGLAACAQEAPAPETTETPAVDSTFAALQAASVNACPADRTQANARSEGFGDFSGVTLEEIATVPSVGNRTIYLRRVTVAPGGVIGWHAHGDAQGMAMLISGAVTEARNNCLDTIAFQPGNVTLEDASLSHGFRNDGAEPAVFLVWGSEPATATP